MRAFNFLFFLCTLFIKNYGQNNLCLLQPLPSTINVTSVVGIEMADFNNDGEGDFVCGGNGISIINSNGVGGYLSPASYTCGAGLIFLRADDFNNDGNKDVVGVNQGPDSNKIVLFFGDGLGGFNLIKRQLAGNDPYKLTSADFNNDGNKDLAIINNSGVMSILLGDGLGSFSPFLGNTIPIYSSDVSCGDFNNDGNKDLAVNSGTSIVILRGLGTGSFSLVNTLNFGFYSSVFSGFKTADINNDGRSDLIGGDVLGNNLLVVKASNNFNFLSPLTYSVGFSGVDVSSDDMNNDGQIDLVASSYGLSGFKVFLNSGVGTFSAQGTYTVGSYFPPAGLPVFSALIFTGNFDNDLKKDVVLGIDNLVYLDLFLNCNNVGLSENIFLSEGLILFPNPAQGIIYIQGQNISESKITIKNNLGEVIKVFNYDVGGIDVGLLENGIYFINIKVDELNVSRKFIIAR
jgi:hypothetical protein